MSLALALDGVDADQDVLLVECDLLLSRGLLTRLARHRQGTLAVVDRYRTGMDGTVVTVENGLVTQVFPPYLQADDFEFRDTYKTLNIYRFSAEFCRETLRPLLAEHLAEVDETSYYEVVLARLGDLDRARDRRRGRRRRRPGAVGRGRRPGRPRRRALPVRALQPRRDPRAHRRRPLGPGPHRLRPGPQRELPDRVDARRHAPRAGRAGLLPRLLAGRAGREARLVPGEPARAHHRAERRVAGAARAARLWAGRDVAIATPAYDELARRFPDARTFPDAPGIDTAELERLAAAGGVIALANPNTLTGTTLDTAWLHGLAAAHPATTFLVDETHVEFSGRASLRSRLDAEPLANVVVIGSLGASVGVPGLRLGYLHSTDPAVRAALRDELPLRHLNSPAEHLLEILLKSRPQLAASLERCRADRDWFRLALLRVPFVAEVHPSGGNFLLARLHGGPSAGAALREHLLTDHAIDVPDVSGAFADRRPRLRIAVRAAEQNAALVSTLTRIGAIPTDHLLERAA